jgi:mono/diheme cytochrome c family protein
MNIPVVLAILVVFGLLGFRKANLFILAISWWVGAYVFFRFGFAAPIPASVISIYMGIVSLATLATVSRASSVVKKSHARCCGSTEKRWPRCSPSPSPYRRSRANVYVQMNVPIEPPFFPRTVHPASPPEITVNQKKISIDLGDNPFRELEKSNPEEFRKHVENGRRVYYQNCVFCHGDNLSGNGMFVHGLDPIPTNFADGDTIANLRETFLFWRASKGGPGLPEEGGPWNSAMPAWEKILKEDEIWEAVLFLYDFTDERPRARVEQEK